MKKTEKTLRIIVVSVGELLACGTIISLLHSGDTERLLLAFVTLLLVLIPEILERLFRCKVNTAVYLAGVLYALGSMMGHCWKFYYTIPCWDKLLHLCGGVMFVILGIYFFELLSRGKANHVSVVVFALCFSMAIFNNANTIGVYRDNRIITTFKTTVKRLNEGASVVIFPEHDVKHNNIVYEFQDGFVDIARLYYKRTGKELAFVPLYIAPKLHKMYLGNPIQFCASAPKAEEHARVCKYLMDEITQIARSLPEHTVVPYRNIPKKDYPSNIPKEVDHEKAGR